MSELGQVCVLDGGKGWGQQPPVTPPGAEERKDWPEGQGGGGTHSGRRGGGEGGVVPGQRAECECSVGAVSEW